MALFKSILSAEHFSAEKMQKVNLFESPHFFCDLYCLEPGQEQKQHAHANEDKIYFVLDGAGTVLIGTEEKSVGQSEICFAAAGLQHRLKNTGKTRMKVLVFMAPHPKYDGK